MNPPRWCESFSQLCCSALTIIPEAQSQQFDWSTQRESRIMAASRPGNTERGWNDPPQFDFAVSSSAQSSTARRTPLNKRVAFPGTAVPMPSNSDAGMLINCPGGESPISPVQLLPPASTSATPTPVPLLIPSMPDVKPTNTLIEGKDSKSDAFKMFSLKEILDKHNLSNEDEMLRKLFEWIDANFQECLPRWQSRQAEEVKRKLQLLKDSWASEKISETAKVKTWEIVQAMSECEYKKAWNLHLLLMVDHTSEVNAWLVGLKKMIHELKERNQTKPLEDSVVSEEKGKVDTIDSETPIVVNSSVPDDSIATTDGDENTEEKA